MIFPNSIFQKTSSKLIGWGCLFLFLTTFTFAETEHERAQRLLKAQRDLLRDIEIILEASPNLGDSRKERITSMAATAYFKNKFSPLWKKDDKNLPKEKAYEKILKNHGLSLQEISIKVQPDRFLDYRKTLRLAEICLLLKEGPPIYQEKWPHWEMGDQPGPGKTSRYVGRLCDQFSKALNSKSFTPQTIEKQFAPSNWVYKRFLNKLDPEAPPEFNIEKSLEVGHQSNEVWKLASHLNKLGYLSDTDLSEIGTTYTESVAQGVRTLQQVKGLKVDGVFGQQTAASLKSSAQAINRTILLRNLNRARLLPNNMGQRHLLANLPSGEVYGFDSTQETLRMRIVFGINTEQFRTPFFREEMSTIIFRPYWIMPTNIAVNEYLSQARSDLSYLGRNGYQIVVSPDADPLPVTYENLDRVEKGHIYIRQKAGGSNVLGKVKFLFPNPHYVYFHDTPFRSLFKQNYRAHSHGCVRLQHPETMANWALSKDEDWDKTSVSKALWGSKKNEVPLKDTIPVYITYFTLFPSSSSDAIYPYPDVYQIDYW